MGSPLLYFTATDNPGRATLRVQAGRCSPHRISADLTGKFCEHLGRNIHNGMWAQILRNPTFADFPFGGAGNRPDGGTKFHTDEAAIERQIRARSERLGWPAPAVDRLAESRADGLAHWWIREGARDAVRVSPDTGPHGERAQRVEVTSAGQGIAQWTYLPLHRVRKFLWRIVARSGQPGRLRLSLTCAGSDRPLATADISDVSRTWKAFAGEIELPPSAPAGAIYRFSLAAGEPGQFVAARALLEPADQIGGADPDVVRLLARSRLPILRWPGGNFASGYHWEDGVGPPDARPTRPNLAWGGVESNLFGTDEFMAFCRAVGCEPMICVNAGNGTPEEAARWVEYCNGPADSPQGARRAANGHPEPYGVRYWEIGNELYGKWQTGWTTAAGYADRYREFVKAMSAVDAGLRLIACGCAPLCVWGGEDWNGRLVADNARRLRSLSDHVLLGGSIDASADPLDVYRAFMAVPAAHEECYAELRDRMEAAGLKNPRLAITEMQLFGRIADAKEGQAVRLSHSNLVSPATMAEAVYDTLFYHVAARLAPFIEMITHSATVNHGGGLRKERERVYANPCHHARAMFAAFADARPVPVELTAPTEVVPAVVPHVRSAGLADREIGVLDAAAALSPDGTLLVSLVHRGVCGPLSLAVEVCDFAPAGHVEVCRLSADEPWAANTLESPDSVAPVCERIEAQGRRLTIRVPRYSVTQLRISPE